MNEETPEIPVVVVGGGDNAALTEARVVASHRPHNRIGMIGDPRVSLPAAILLGAATLSMGAGGMGGSLMRGFFGGGPRGYPRGDCEICGKKNVAAGHLRGIYRCREHLE